MTVQQQHSDMQERIDMVYRRRTTIQHIPHEPQTHGVPRLHIHVSSLQTLYHGTRTHNAHNLNNIVTTFTDTTRNRDTPPHTYDTQVAANYSFVKFTPEDGRKPRLKHVE